VPDSDLQITLGADASGVTQGVGEAKSALTEFAPRVDAVAKSVSGLASQLKDGLEGVSQFAEGLKKAETGGLDGLSGIAEAGAGASAVVAALANAVRGASTAMTSLDLATDANPFGLLALSVGAVVLAMVAWKEKTGDQIDAENDLKAAQQDELDLTGRINDLGVQASNAAIQTANGKLQEAAARLKNAMAAAAEADALNHGGNLTGDIYGALGQSAAAKDAEAANQVLRDRTAEVKTYAAEIDKLWSHMQAIMNAKPPTLAGVGGGHGSGGGGGDPLQRQMQAWTTEWQHLADMAAVITGNANVDLLQAEIKFWADKLRTAKAGTEEYYAILERLNPLVAQLQQQQAEAAKHSAEEQKRATDEMVRDVLKSLDEEIRAHKEAVRKMEEEQRRALAELKRDFSQIANPLVSSFISGFLRMAEGAQNFATTLRQIGQQILNDAVRFTDMIVEKWLWSQTEKVLATERGQAFLRAIGLSDMADAVRNDVLKTTSHAASEHARTAATVAGVTARAGIENAGFFAQIISKLAALLGIHIATEGAKTAVTVGNASARAGASGVASFAEAPWPIDTGAPAFGAAMAAAAGSFGALSAAGGFDIPAGVNPLTQLHAREMVLPARLANPMREMLAKYSGGGGGAWSGTVTFGDTHIHTSSRAGPDIRTALAEHRHLLADQFFLAIREGKRAPRGLGSPFAA
jgi:hypothetical protein